MLRNIFFVLLLIYAVNAANLESSEVDSAEDQDEEIYGNVVQADSMPKQQSSIKCKLCKLIMKALKKKLPPKPRMDEIKAKLHKGCDFLIFRKDSCKQFVEKYMDKLVKELMTDDVPKAICTKIHVCKLKRSTS